MRQQSWMGWNMRAGVQLFMNGLIRELGCSVIDFRYVLDNLDHTYFKGSLKIVLVRIRNFSKLGFLINSNFRQIIMLQICQKIFCFDNIVKMKYMKIILLVSQIEKSCEGQTHSK